MSKTVKQVIAMLRKQDPEAIVVFRDHDQSEDEFNGFVNIVAPNYMPLLRTDHEKLVILEE